MEKFEREPNLKDAQAQISQTREQFKKEREFRAKERNRYRTIWQKIFGLGKTTEMDIAIEEALRMDAEIETLMREGKVASTTEAVELIEKEGKFGLKGKERISKEEWARFRALQFAGALEKNDLGKASEIVYRARQEKVDDESRQILEETIAPLIIQKVAELVQNRDGKNFVRAFYELSRLHPITAEGLSQKDLQSPEIQGAIKEDLIKRASIGPLTYSEMRDKLANGGFIDAKEVNQLPEVQEIIKSDLIDRAKIGPRTYSKRRDEWVAIGVIKPETIDQLPEVQEIIKSDLIDRAKIGPRTYSKRRDEWVAIGVINAEEANGWIKSASIDIF
jgi:hypothetical protein